MALLDERARALAAMAHWREPRSERDGSYRFALENDLTMTLLSPDGRMCILRAELTDIPQEEPAREDLLRMVLRHQAGVCTARASVVALEHAGESLLSAPATGERLILQALLALDAPQHRFEEAVRDFLNDLAWWKHVLNSGQASGTLPPFPLPDRFFGGVY